MIKQLKEINKPTPPVVVNKNNNLDKDIEDVKPPQQQKPKKKLVTLKDVFKKKSQPSKFIDIDVRVNIVYDQYNPSRKHQQPFTKKMLLMF